MPKNSFGGSKGITRRQPGGSKAVYQRSQTVLVCTGISAGERSLSGGRNRLRAFTGGGTGAHYEILPRGGGGRVRKENKAEALYHQSPSKNTKVPKSSQRSQGRLFRRGRGASKLFLGTFFFGGE